MTIDEIKSVSILQWMRTNNYGNGQRRGKNVFFCSPFRSERTPSFSVNPDVNLWHDFGNGKGGNLINLIEQLNPTWSSHQVLSWLQKQIEMYKLEYTEDYNARIREEEEKQQWIEGRRIERESVLSQETVIRKVVPLNHPCLREYIIHRHVDYSIAQSFCKEVHYTVHDKYYYAIGFINNANGMEVRNKFNKRCIGKKSISAIYPIGTPQKQCCVFEGFFDMLSYLTIEALMPETGITIRSQCDLFVLNGVGEVKLLLPYLNEYDYIHCYLDNDDAGKNATSTIINVYPGNTVDESYRYKGYADLNDYLIYSR